MCPFNIPKSHPVKTTTHRDFFAANIKKSGEFPRCRTFNIKPGTLANSPQSTARHIKIAPSV